MEPLQIYLLGGFAVKRGDTPLPPIPSRAARSLFAYLVVNRDRRHARSYLAGLYWPELPEARARRRLSQSLWQLHDALDELPGGQSYLQATPDEVGFNAQTDHWVDVDEFGRIIDQLGVGSSEHPLGRATDMEALRQCVDLYQGDFLAGFSESWVLIEQQRLRDKYVGALGTLVAMAKARGDYEEALSYARRLTHHDPLREEAHREAMRLLVLLGRPNEAILQYQRCQSVLEEELGTEPAAATVDLYDQIRRHRQAGIQAVPTERHSPLLARAEAPFVGRRSERSALIDRMEQALGGRGGIVLVEGEPGVGKTRLVAEAAADARWRGFDVLWGACPEIEVPRPYLPLVDALEPALTELRVEQIAQQIGGVWLREVARIVPALDERLPDLPDRVPLRDADEPQRMREALAMVFQALGRVGPTMVVLDDLQWADEETLNALRQVGDVLAGSRVLVCLIYRTEEARRQEQAWETIRRLDQRSGVGRVLVAALSVFETDELIQQSLGTAAPGRSLAARIHAETGGNPLFVLETLRSLHDQGLVGESEPAIATGGALPLADTVHRVISDRIGFLGATARLALDALAVQGYDADLDTLTEVSALPKQDVLEAVDDLLRRGLLVDGEDGYRFRHDQVRKVAYDTVEADARVPLHRAVARALQTRRPQGYEVIAHHCRLGEDWDGAVRYLRLAGERAAGLHAYQAAATHLGRAVELAQPAETPPSEVLELLASRERALEVLGQREQQAAVLDHMTRLAADPTWKAEVAIRRAWLLAMTDRFDDAEAVAAGALADHTAPGPRLQRRLLMARGTALSWAGRAREALPFLEQAAAPGYEDPRAEADARTALGRTLGELQQYETAAAELTRALQRYEEIEDRRGQAEALGLLATVLMEQGDAARGEHTYRQALRICRDIGYRHGEALNLANLATQLYVGNRVGEAVDLYGEAATTFRTVGNRRGEARVLANLAAVRHLILGDDARARREIDQALSYFREVGDGPSEAHCLEVLAGIDARRGNTVRARRQLETGLEIVHGSGHHWLAVHLERSLAVLDLADGSAEAALQRVERAAEAAGRLGMHDVAVMLQGLRGRALLESGRISEAVAAIEDVDERIGGVEQGYLVSFWRYRILEAAGRIEAAHRSLERAYRELLAAVEPLTDEQRAAALAAVPEHRAIVEEWQAIRPRMETVSLPAADAPTGRPLRNDEWVEVTWAVAEPADRSFSDGIAQRRHRLLRLVEQARRQGAAPTIVDLATALAVSPATIRRDLAALRRQGKAIFTRGSRSA